MARTFKVLEGVHFQDGHEYKKGETLTSERDLVTLFTGKFADMGPASAPVPSALSVGARPPAPAEPIPGPQAAPQPSSPATPAKPAAKPSRSRKIAWD